MLPLFSSRELINSLSFLSFFLFRVCQLQYSHILHFENFHPEWKQFVADIKLEEELEAPEYYVVIHGHEQAASAHHVVTLPTCAKRDRQDVTHPSGTISETFGHNLRS